MPDLPSDPRASASSRGRGQEELRRAVRAILSFVLFLLAGYGLLVFVGDYLTLHRRLDEARGFRAGIPATMLPKDRERFTEFPITYKGAKMTARHYPSAASGTAANADYFVIINSEGIVEAAFSTDVEEGREWVGRYR